MNDPSKTPIDIEEQKSWIADLHKQLGSWSEVAKRTGVPAGTISQFASPKGYSGDNEKIAQKVFQYRQMLVAHASVVVEMPERPDYFEAPTATKLIHMLTYSHRYSRIVVAAMGPGTSKTAAAEHYQACFPNVFLATMTPSTSGVNNMQIEVLKALNEPEAKGTPQKLTHRIIDRAQSVLNPLLIIDEAQHLSEKALDEIRGWNDRAKIGIALFGNAGVLQRLEGGSRKIGFAQLFSRIGLRLEQQLPLIGDIDAFADAWGVVDQQAIASLRKICLKPGGLRNGAHTLELAFMLASSHQATLGADHIQDAWGQLSSQSVLA